MADILTSYEPATGKVLWSGESASSTGVDAAMAKARKAFPAWASTSLDHRIERLRAFQAKVRERADAFAELIARETGKPLWDAKGEVDAVAAKVDISIQAHDQRTGTRTQEADGLRQALRHRPHGVLGVLGPYNFPAHLPNGQIVPALLAGNVVVFKPSELTPASAAFMAACWRDSGLPNGVLSVVQGDGRIGKALAGHADLDGLLFTGSATTGAALHRQFADAPHKVLALEMGGNNPLIWWDGDDLEAAAQVVVQSAFLSSGQRCTCARRLILPEHLARSAIEALVAVIDRLIVGDPFDQPQPFMGPVIDMRAANGLTHAFRDLVGRGGKSIRELAAQRPGLPFLSPALIDVTDVADPSDEERFGPLLQLVRVPDFDAALAAANATRFGLSAGLVGGDEALYQRFWTGVRAGVVNWNRPMTGASSNAPFGGVGASGNHRPAAYYAADACAYPVASLEALAPSPPIAHGLAA
ncbi:succinylglutamate-semialdehyde dehydrogenase [Caulobacter sp. S45]|uniref:succinylglutamate-semialdehyde dehydrogenase n=1 Tax=Caulobacter sp. S45 TaxID=1641861 RepID=UPI00131BE923|nr:succinylglutamate-semialdehyde dehydrogenase [Caulobacter sp. S45]